MEQLEATLKNLSKRNDVLNYLMKTKNSVIKARNMLSKCILQQITEGIGDDE